MGRPRMLRDENNVIVRETPSIEKSIENGSSKFKPYLGSDLLPPNEPRFFVNQRKVIKVLKLKVGEDDNKQPVYKVERSLFTTIYDRKKEGQRLRSELRKLGIPGA